MTVETTRGAEQTISTTKYEITGRGGKGRELLQRGQFTKVVPVAPEAPDRSPETSIVRWHAPRVIRRSARITRVVVVFVIW